MPSTAHPAALIAARGASRKALGPAFCAFEGPDFELHTIGASGGETHHLYRLRGPAADAA